MQPTRFLSRSDQSDFIAAVSAEEVTLTPVDPLQPCLFLVDSTDRRINITSYSVSIQTAGENSSDSESTTTHVCISGSCLSNIGSHAIQVNSRSIRKGQYANLQPGDTLQIFAGKHKMMRIEEGQMKFQTKVVQRPSLFLYDKKVKVKEGYDVWRGGMTYIAKSGAKIELLQKEDEEEEEEDKDEEEEEEKLEEEEKKGVEKAEMEEREEEKEEKTQAAQLTVEELMDREFSRIVGQDALKQQLRQFYKQVQLDQIRAKAGKEKDTRRLYHMIFSGPPGTGKTTMAYLVSKMMLQMKLVKNDKVVFVNNALELLGQYHGSTGPKVDAIVKRAKGGICFIDEAYSVVREGPNSGFGKEAIDTIMKHMSPGDQPPTCVFIFAGYEKPMSDFLRMNEGLARRIPYRYTFEAYTLEQLSAIFLVMCRAKGELLGEDIDVAVDVPKLLESIDPEMLSTQNGGLIGNWIAFAQGERDSRVDLNLVLVNQALANTLTKADLEAALIRVQAMKGPEKPAAEPVPAAAEPEHEVAPPVALKQAQISAAHMQFPAANIITAIALLLLVLHLISS